VGSRARAAIDQEEPSDRNRGHSLSLEVLRSARWPETNASVKVEPERGVRPVAASSERPLLGEAGGCSGSMCRRGFALPDASPTPRR